MAVIPSVVRLDLWVHPVFDEMLGSAGDVRLSVLPANGDDAQVREALATAHAYHVSAAKDELPRRWFVDADCLRDCPSLLFVSSSGAGYDTVDVEACTRAGVAVMNQTGGNAVSVAEHTLAMILGTSHRAW